MLNSTLLELSGLLAAKKISSVELTRACVERIGRLNGELNAFISFDEGKALAAARRADEVREADQREAYQSVAPAVQDGLYLVPKVIE